MVTASRKFMIKMELCGLKNDNLGNPASDGIGSWKISNLYAKMSRLLQKKASPVGYTYVGYWVFMFLAVGVLGVYKSY